MLHPKPRKASKPRPTARIGEETVTMRELRDFVIFRDGPCILAVLDPGHSCRGQASLEHVIGVHDHHDPRIHDDAHCVALCLLTNIDHTSKAERDLIRDHLRALHPRCTRLSSLRGGDG